MPEYIEREALLKNAQTYSLEFGEYIGEDVRDVDAILADRVKEAPAADVAEVVHGRWEQRKTPLGKTHSICSNCSTDFEFITDKGTLARLNMDGMPYCPNCGCKMDKEDET